MAVLIEYGGLRWRQRKDGYFGNSRHGLLHRRIWADHNGPIPRRMHVHHDDEDKTNNAIENLILLTPAEHFARHERNTEWHRAGGRAPKPERTVTCGHCGTEFRTRNSRTDISLACSQRCWTRLRDAEHRGRGWTISTCAECGCDFQHLAKSKRVVCSIPCRTRYVARVRKDRVRPHGRGRA